MKKAVVVDMTLKTVTLKIEGGEKQRIKSKQYHLLLGDKCQVSIDSRTGRIREVIKDGVHGLDWQLPEESEEIGEKSYDEDWE